LEEAHTVNPTRKGGEATMTQGLQENGQTAVLATPVVMLDRDEYAALVSEVEFLSTAFVRQRVVSIVGGFTLAIAAALVAFLGGLSVGQRINDESFKFACSRVVDEAVKKVKISGARVLQMDDLSPDAVQKVSN
jgi:hypothetical protein